MRDVVGRKIVYRYPTIAKMAEALIDVYDNAECECRPALPDGREFEMCLPCKVQQDVERWRADQMVAMEFIGHDEVDIPFSF